MAYIYQAASWCDSCGAAIRERLTEEGKAPEDPDDEHTYDSDDFPKGPFSDDDESDSPNHCDAGAECLEALDLHDGSKVGAIVSGLTEEGIVYVRVAITEQLASKNPSGNSAVVAAWREHYDLEPFEIELDNLDDREGTAEAIVRGPGAAKWAKEHDQSIGGSRWETPDNDGEFAHACPTDYPGLVEALQKEGYHLNLDNYSPPTEDELGRGDVEDTTD